MVEVNQALYYMIDYIKSLELCQASNELPQIAVLTILTDDCQIVIIVICKELIGLENIRMVEGDVLAGLLLSDLFMRAIFRRWVIVVDVNTFNGVEFFSRGLNKRDDAVTTLTEGFDACVTVEFLEHD